MKGPVASSHPPEANVSTTERREDLFRALREGPAILFLGQRVLSAYGQTDHFLQALAQRLHRPEAENYSDLLQEVDRSLREGLPVAMREISRLTIPPPWLVEIARAPWNAVFTSAFHEVTDRALQSEWRHVSPLLSDSYWPEDPLNRRDLHVFKLFGCVTGGGYSELPPLDDNDRLRREGVAAKMLEQLPSLVTPRGVLVLEAYGADDWLDFGAVAPHIARLAPGQAHWFGVSEPPANRRAQVLIQQGRLVLHPEPFVEWVRSGLEQGLLTVTDVENSGVDGVSLTTRSGKRRTFSLHDWRQRTQGLPVLHDAAVAAAPPFDSDDDRYLAFRQFLYDSGTHPPRWEDHDRGFPFVRKEARELYQRVFEALADSALKPDPLLLCGQSGSGKTVGLANLAFQARKQRWPVIHLHPQYTRLNFDVLSDVCEDLEKVESQNVLVVWDALNDPGEYAALAQYLAGRGRKALVVGSAYKADDSFDRVLFLNALHEEETQAFAEHLGKIDQRLVPPPDQKIDRNFFALLYGRLPPTRAKLEQGIRREWDVVLRQLQEAPAPTQSTAPDREGWLWAAIDRTYPGWKPLRSAADRPSAGAPAADRPSAGTPPAGAEARAHMARLLLVPGRFGVGLPVDLALRAARNAGVDGFEVLRSESFENLGVFFWEEDPQGNPVLRVRSALEAAIICDADFVIGDQETDVLRELVTAVRLGDWERPSAETDFLTRLFDKIEPDGEFGYRFLNRLPALVGMLADLRASYGNRIHPSLALREANLRRKWLYRLTDSLEHDQPLPDGQDPLELFRIGRELLIQAEAAAEQSQSRNRLVRIRSQLLNELGSLYGGAQKFYGQLLRHEERSTERSRWEAALADSYVEAIDACRQASAIDPRNAHPADVRYWVSRDRLQIQQDDLSPTSKGELFAEMCDALEEETWVFQPTKLQERQYELGKLMGIPEMSRSAIEALHAEGSLTGHYLIASAKVYDTSHRFRDRSSLLEALAYLEGISGAIEDLRVLRLYLSVWWQVHGEPHLFDKDRERSRVALTVQQWRHFARLLERRLSFKEEEGHVRARFLLAWALFQSGDYQKSEDQFTELGRLPRSGVDWAVRRAVWCNDRGEPVPCQGTIRQLFYGDERGRVYCPEVGLRIPFEVQGFKAQDLRINAPLKDFYIAFNFRGPIADPIRAYR